MDYIRYIRSRMGHDPINIPGVNVLILSRNDEILLQKRGDYPYTWGLIGGIVELGESFEEAAIRETKEETGLHIHHLQLFGTTSGKDCYMELPNQDKVYYLTAGFFTYEYEGTLQADGQETLDLQFFPITALPPLPQSHQQMIHQYLAKKETKYR